MATVTICGCGKEVSGKPNAGRMHEQSATHLKWELEQLRDQVSQANHDKEAKTAPTLVDPDLDHILGMARAGESPLALAKLVRVVWNRHDWPDKSQPMTMRAFLETHNIPILDPPSRHMTEGEVNTWRERELRRIKDLGWGSPRWEIK